MVQNYKNSLCCIIELLSFYEVIKICTTNTLKTQYSQYCLVNRHKTDNTPEIKKHCVVLSSAL